MQKFTLFSILFSATLILVLGDLIVHDYLKTDSFEAEFTQSQELPYLVENDTEDEFTNSNSIEASDTTELSGSIELNDPMATVRPRTELPDLSSDIEEDVLVELQSEVRVDQAALASEQFVAAGFADPVLKNTIYSGLMFNFIPFSDQTTAQIQQWNLFDGEDFMGSLYEFRYPTETGSFQAYLTLRDRASSMTSEGTVNEVNLYGASSFYFNHNVKTKTVHHVIRSGSSLFAFEYAYAHHEKMKNLFDLL